MVKTEEIEGYELTYEITGSGSRTVIILQEWGTNLKCYEKISEVIDSEYRVIRLELPGFDGSTEPHEAWNTDAYANFVCRFVQALGVSNVALIGHGFGGRLAIKLASKKKLPFRISQIVLINTAYKYPKSSFMKRRSIKKSKALGQKFASYEVCDAYPELCDFLKNHYESGTNQGISSVMQQSIIKCVDEDLTKDLREITQCVLLIYGAEDHSVPTSMGNEMNKLLKNSSMDVLIRAGHYPFLEQDEVFPLALKRFFQIGVMTKR